MKLKETELKAILAEVEQEINDLLKAEGKKLAKAAGDDDAEGSAPPEGSSAPPDAPEASPGEESPGEASAPADKDASPAPADASPAPGADGQDPAADDQPMDMESLKAEYAKLPPEELKMHYMAAKAALFMAVGGGQEASAAGDAGQPAPAPSAPPSEASAPAPAMKKELQASPGSGGQMKKSETAAPQVDPRDEEIKLLKSQVEGLAVVVDKVLAQPLRKAITSVAHLPKTEVEKKTLTKEEINVKLSEKAREPLKKSDRDLINKFYTGSAGLADIEHLLK